MLLLCSAKPVKRAGQGRLNLHLFVQRRHPSTRVQLRFRSNKKPCVMRSGVKALISIFLSCFLSVSLSRVSFFLFFFFFSLSHVCESLKQSGNGSEETASERIPHLLVWMSAASLTLGVYAAEGSSPLLQPESAALLAPWKKKAYEAPPPMQCQRNGGCRTP